MSYTWTTVISNIICSFQYKFLLFIISWQVDDVSASENPAAKDGEKQEINHILTRLKPYTQYAFYVKTYTVATEKSGAQSPIQYFRTEPDSKLPFFFF